MSMAVIDFILVIRPSDSPGISNNLAFRPLYGTVYVSEGITEPSVPLPVTVTKPEYSGKRAMSAAEWAGRCQLTNKSNDCPGRVSKSLRENVTVAPLSVMTLGVVAGKTSEEAD